MKNEDVLLLVSVKLQKEHAKKFLVIEPVPKVHQILRYKYLFAFVICARKIKRLAYILYLQNDIFSLFDNAAFVDAMYFTIKN